MTAQGNFVKQVLSIVAAAAALTLGASAAHAAISITVSTTLAPNAFGSPSYSAWVQNAIDAQDAGLSTFGAAGPTQFNTTGSTMNVSASQGVVTGFNSWMGVADPAAPYQSELGNRMSFSLVVNGDGQQIEIDKLSFNAASSDAGNALGFNFGEGAYAYSTQYVGVNFGIDGHLGGGDDSFITSGSSNQLVDAIIGRGSGNSLAAYCPGCSQADEQAAIDAQAAYWTKPATFTGTYTYDNGSVGGVTGSGIVQHRRRRRARAGRLDLYDRGLRRSGRHASPAQARDRLGRQTPRGPLPEGAARQRTSSALAGKPEERADLTDRILFW